MTEPNAAVARAGSSSEGGPRTLRDWLAEREPPVPGALLSHLSGERSVALTEPLLETLGAEARVALGDARRESGERRGAYRLLVADAYLTYACEVALQSDDPAAALLHIVHQVVEEAGEG